ncbi:hypothetical protein LTR17_023012 [Elasticomyces elasticus]|nr:hypothetical protein LTR17_023012 [Elasticomyces elasticus]
MSLTSSPSLPTGTSRLPPSLKSFDRGGSSDDRVVLGDGTADQATPRGGQERDEGENSYAFALALDPVIAPAEHATLFYTGDKSSALGFLGDICQPNSTQRGSHYLVPRTSKKTKGSEDLSYLRSKGAFSLPSKELPDELICLYFRHVHPLVPIVDAQSFLHQYLEHGTQDVNLLLLWSMFFAAANNSGYQTRKAMKRAMYQRAKCLYDSDYEPDQLSLIQSVILLGFWYTDTEDRTGAWHWIGIAISLSQTLGFHRSPESVIDTNRLPERRRRLFRRIWWSCFVRDRWLSLAKGRPMRINPNDCDVPLPSMDDIT